MSEDLPVAIWSGTVRLFGIDLRCSVLDDGRRVILAEDAERLFAALESGKPPTRANNEALAAFMRWYHQTQ